MNASSPDLDLRARNVARSPLPWVRWSLLAALLLAEILLLSIRYDIDDVKANPHFHEQWWAKVLEESSALPQLAIAVASAGFLFGGRKLRDEYESVADRRTRRLPAWPFLIGNLIAYAIFARLTEFVFKGAIWSSAVPWSWFILWFAAGSASFLLLLAAAFPPNLWLRFLKRGFLPLAIIFLIGVASLIAGRLTGGLWQSFRVPTFAVAQWLLQAVFPEVINDPAEFKIVIPATDQTSAFGVSVAPECSGYEGIGLIWVFFGLYLWYFRDELRFPHALLLLPIGTVLIWFANAFRIAALVAVGVWVRRDVAVGGFHSQAGWLIFNVITLGMIGLTRSLGFFRKSPPVNCGPAMTNPTIAYLSPFLAVLAVEMATGAFSAGFDRWYALRVIIGGAVIWRFRRGYQQHRISWSGTAFFLGVVVFALWVGLAFGSHAGHKQEAIADALRTMSPLAVWTWIAFRIVGSVVIAPIAEELAFRGFLVRRLIATRFDEVPIGRFTWFSCLVSSALFGLLHPGHWLAGTLAGMLFSMALYRRRQLGDAILSHAVANALVTAYVLATDNWSLW